MKHRRAVLGCLFLLCAAALNARRADTPGCGTHAEIAREQVFLHRQALRAHGWKVKGHEAAVALAAQTTNRDYGDIAVIEDSDGVISRPNKFDLDQKTITFVPAAANAASYHIQSGAAAFDSYAAANGALQTGMADDDSREISIPFSFPFFGATYRSVFINSDGNLTFGKGDADTTERSLGRMVAGSPRIAPLFTDLDPSSAAAPKGVRVVADPSRLIVTWSSVPLWESFGIGAEQTFQARLYPDGKIEFAYAGTGADLQEAVVGIAPGALRGSASVISLLDPTSQEFTAAIAERFSVTQAVDIATVAQKFYATHDDAYDYLVIYNAVGVSAAQGAVAYEVTVRNRGSGFGDQQFDIGNEFGSARRLQAIMNMGPLNQYGPDPNSKLRTRASDTPVTVLGHEAGHLFLAFVSVPDPNNPGARPMLGRDGAHWAFTFNSEASLLEGNRIQDKGEGVTPRFVTTGAVEAYSPLDQYLMGLLEPSRVRPTFAVLNSGQNASRPPQTGVSFSGERLDIRVEDIIAVAGRRTPDSTVAQRRFRFAFILIVPPGATPTAELTQVDAYRAAFEHFFSTTATNERASADTSLRRAVHLSAAPAMGILRGGTAAINVSLDKPVDAPVTLLVEQQAGSAGVIEAPSSVTIAAGAREASFTITGARAGVVELAARPADSAYETAYSRIQVLDSSAGLQLSLVSGNDQGVTPGSPLPQPIVVQATDINRLPYPGVRVSASVSSGTLASDSAITDANGNASFEWIPGASAPYEFTARIPGAGGELVVTASPRPVILNNGVVDAASYSPGITPGSIATVFGSALAGGAEPAPASLPLPYDLAGTQVMLNGTPVPLYYVSDNQVNFVVPPSLSGSTADIVVTSSAGSSAAYRAAVRPVAPAIFFDSATGAGAIRIAGTAQTPLDRPAAAGETIEIYCTGLGATTPSGDLEMTTTTPRVTIAGVDAEVTYSGLAPGYPGLYQVNATVPAGLAPGDQILSMEMAGSRSNEVTVRLR